MDHKKLLLVEGIDDLHAIRNLVFCHDISVYSTADENTPSIDDCDFEIRKVGGKDHFKAAISNALGLGKFTTLGVVGDADEDPEACWQSIVNYLLQHIEDRSFEQIGDFDAKNGWLDTALNTVGDTVQVGVWVMPDNLSEGFLEDFAAGLVPDDDDLWPHAGEVIDELPRRPFKSVQEGKARMHTYLAWQDPPREPIGRSIISTDGPLTTDSDLALRFVEWVKRLFEVTPAV